MAELTTTRITATEYYQLPESTQPIELLDGEVIVNPAPVPKHQRIVFDLGKLIDDIKPNGQVFLAPIDVYLDDANVVQPDIVWVAENSRCTIGALRLEGPPDLIVEVFAPGTARKDKTIKFDLYEKHGVRAYWMVDPAAQYVDVHALQNDAYQRVGVFGPDDTFEPGVLGASVGFQRVFGG